jgi:putative component of membrane protein insertase Oxa1/YidC/SpoIIIJ protein YidD/uncharacterized membrane protein YhaH (DUF805 family)
MPVHRSKKVAVLLLAGAAACLAVESFQPPHRQLTARVCLAAIDAYQAAGSPVLQACGLRCRYTPTCSHYAEDAIGRYGTIEGLIRTAGRLGRCAPWGGCGHDPAVASLSGTPQQETPEERKARQESEKAAREIQQAAKEWEKAVRGSGKEAAEGCAVAGAGCVIAIIFSIIMFGVAIAIMVWVFKDAKARGDQNAVLWLVLVFFTGIIGLIIYIVVRPKGDLAPCANCHNKKLMTLVKCPHCGQESGAGGAAVN